MPRPTAIELHLGSRQLEVRFDNGEAFRLPCEYLRVHSPSAEVQGHSQAQRVLQFGKLGVNIRAIHPIGHYAVQLAFDDGHDSGLYSWDMLYDLGRNHDAYWQQYLDELAAAGKSRTR